MKYRKLKVGEIIKSGDQFYSSLDDRWINDESFGTPQTGRMLTESHISFRRPVKAESRKPRTQQLKPKMPCWDEVVNGVFGVDGVRTVPAREAMLARKVYNFITRHFGH